MENNKIINDRALTKKKKKKRIQAFIDNGRIVENFVGGRYLSIYNLRLLKIVEIGQESNV